MGYMRLFILLINIASYLGISNGCQISGGINLGPVPNHLTIEDTFKGIIRSETTTNIERIASISYGGALVSSQAYLTITHQNSQFVVQTSSAFEQYEENEVALNFPVTITFECTGGNTSPLILMIHITDTNNNYPEFVPRNAFEFVVTAPLPPGFLITGCLNEIIVKDIDLTTSSIIFEIEDNPYFELEYDAASCPAPATKHFKAQLRTATFIRTLREPMTLRITATDVDATGDPPLSTSGTIRISGNPQFEFPDEPVFDQSLYFASYTDEHQIIHHETIFLRQGFDEGVIFSLEGEYKDYFAANPIDNQVSLVVSTPLPTNVLDQKEIYMIVRADKEYTSGGSATVVINLPEDTPLSFERAHYEGSIVDNTLQLSPLVLSEGYEGVTVSAEIVGEYTTSFTASVQENVVTVTMISLTDDIIEDNSFISIHVVASTHRSQATTIVTLGIIKDDLVTPAFDKSIYAGSYNPDNGLTVEQITFVQGFDETVSVDLLGEHKNLFQINAIGPVISLTSSTIPPELFEEQRITLSIEASKPRTVGANAAIIITLPATRELSFEESTYRGTIFGTNLLLQSIILSEGYDPNVRFNLDGDYSNYFSVTNVQNQVAISLSSLLPDSVITQNNIITLTLTAFGLNALTTTTSVILDVIKADTTTPVLSQNIYYGTYRGPSHFEIENIFLTQGYDDEVSFSLDDSAHAQYFDISNTGNSATITLRSAIPEDVIFNEKVLLFNVLADKALTVGSNAAVLIRFPTELTESTILGFSQNNYIGSLEQNKIILENIILDTGYATGTEFILSGDYAVHFDIVHTNNVVQITSKESNSLPPEVIDNNGFIVLTVEANRERAVSARTSVIIDIVKEEIIQPVFNQAYYRGLYDEENNLQFEEHIDLSEGYDETVRFGLAGEQAVWFSVSHDGNSVKLVLESPIPQTVLDVNNQLLFTIFAIKENGVSGRAVISIDVYKDEIRFPQEYYKGYIIDGLPSLDAISIQDLGIPSDSNPMLSGEYSDYFQVVHQNNMLTLELKNPIPVEILEENNLLILTLTVQNANTRLSTVIVLEIHHTEIEQIELKFEKTYYIGSYNQSQGLIIDDDFKLNNFDLDNVIFDLEGADAQWFGLEIRENSVKLILNTLIPPTVLLNYHQLIFEVTADRPGSETARSIVVISLTERSETVILGFDQINYLGSIENDRATVEPITLSEGYVPGVVFELRGELENHFSITSQGAAVTVTLLTPIPEQSIPANRIIVLEMQASAPQALPAYATLVFEYVIDDEPSTVIELIFAQTYYTGSYYTEEGGLVFTTPISLIEGYDATVQFALEGDQAQWFTLEGPGNSQTLVLSSSIPAGVLANNRQLVFVVNAQRAGSKISRATIVISLDTEYTEGSVLGFDRVTYLGSIENDRATVEPITLSEGYVPGVVFELRGELENHFSITSQGAAVTVTLLTPIPEQSIPANRIIVLEMQASAPQALPAYATLVFEYVVDDEPSTVIELIFAQTYYTGSYYTEEGGLVFTTPISLIEGYDATVQFALEGDQAQWFTLEGPGNSQTLVLSSSIPAGVLANNRQLVFVVNAQRAGSKISRATIVISLDTEYTEGSVLGFDRVTYLGSIENDRATVEPITLSEGYVPGVVFELRGELENHFSITSQGAAVTVTLLTPIPEQSIPANRIIVLELQASAPQALPAYATLVFEYVVDDEPSTVIELIFAQTYYTGSYYTEEGGLVFTTPISLIEGYDATVQFALEGDQAQWFTLEGPGNSQTLVLSSSIPAGVLANNRQLVFVVNAQRAGSKISRATIVISLDSEYTEGSVLGFDRVTYLGSIENDRATVEPITLSEGYVPGVVFELRGELENHFSITSQGTAVTVTLLTPIPEQSIPANRIIVLELQASAPQALPAYATLVFEYVVDDEPSTVIELIFAQTYYTGSYYTEEGGLVFTTPISLIEGYDATVQFALEGDQAQWFTLEGPGNSQTLVLSSSIPAGVLANNRQLVFVVNAQRAGSKISRATIVISLDTEYTEGSVLGFDRVTYLGSIENDRATVEPIQLSEGYVPGVVFELRGELENHFSITSQGAAVTVTLLTPIPEQSIPANRIIVLELQASAPQALPAYATLVFEYVVDDEPSTVIELIFAQTYYTGSYYTEEGGLVFTTPISLIEGYDATVQFALEGDQAQWFTLEGPGNSQTLVLSSSIPAGVLANNRQLVFVVNAQRAGSKISRATIVISLDTEYTEGSVLGFDRVTYLGSIENDRATVEPITLSEGYVPGVVFELRGELENHFSITSQGAAVTVTLLTPIPEQSIPANRIIVLEMQASAPQALPAYATLVFEYVVDDEPSTVIELIFAQTYYTGSYYTEEGGLVFTTPISLIEGYDATVQFALEGDQAQWFTLEGPGNSQTLVLSSSIPAGVLANNRQLVFVVNAQRAGSKISRATIVISLDSEYTEGSVLGFDRVTYLGSIENDRATVEPITLSEGYVPGVVFELRGELENHFSITSQGAAVTVTLLTPIPEQSIPANRIIVLEMQASAPQALPAYATLVFEYVVDDEPSTVIELIFAQTYYTGSYYTEEGGLVFTTPISLIEGYDATVQFALEGDQAQWFTLEGLGNSQTLVLSSSIPAGVLANNRQLVFVVNAQRAGSKISRATIVISLDTEYTEGSVLGFDRVTYLGSIENDRATVEPITLSEGYVPGVVFELRGELENHFSITSQGAAVTVTLLTPIPEQSIPANRIIVLEMQASAPQALPAYATLVFEYVVDDEPSTVIELIFAQTYYTGSYYTEEGGLVFTTPISLIEGYDATVQFALEGDQAQWFTLEGPGNSQTLVLSSSIPAGVLANNRQLVFVVNAQRAGSKISRATIVISLDTEYTEGSVLGFDRVTYLGSIENDRATVEPITLSEGYVPGVVFELRGELENHFSITSQRAAVTVTLLTPIPEQSIPANRIIVLELQASAPQALPAYATLVFEYVVDDEPSTVIELIFAQIYYTGSYYTEEGGLVFTTPISLIEGYDATVQFALEGDQAQWFTLEGPGNSQTLVLSSSIPAGVLANNRQLVFVVNAQRAGSKISRATIVISLDSEYTEGSVLGFDRVTYLGSIENDRATVEPITLSEGYVPGVVFELRGELENHFSITSQGAAVTVTLLTPIPEQSIPANRIIVLEMQASAPQALPAYATLVFEYVVDDEPSTVIELIFAQTYYTGSYYTEEGGLVFTTPISLIEGYDATVQFALEGDQAQWFTLEGPGNSQTLVLSSSIPAGVLANNRQLVFVVNAQRAGSKISRATIVISLDTEYTEGSVLGFDRITYLGSIENDRATVEPITLSEGYVPGVVFELRGELENHFSITSQGAAVTVTLLTTIPEQSIPANRIIVLELQASAPQALPAYATLVFEYVVDDEPSTVIELIFAQTYYTGSYYTEEGGLVFTTPISLIEGYDATVQFALEGDQAQWFTLEGPGNSQTLVLSSSIPAGVLANNRQLVFVVNAQRAGSKISRATIVISLDSEYTEGSVLGFDRVTYLGSIENDRASVEPITLSEGYVPGVVFELRGELENHFSITSQGAAVTVTLLTPIPEQSIPANRIIVLEMQASAPQALPAYATLVFEYVVDDEPSTVIELIFAQTYYTGSYYTEEGSLVFTTPISLIEGYDATVQFALEGDQAQWFTLEGLGNSQTLVLSSSIPAGVLANNRQLVFVVNAQRAGSKISRATIVISLDTEYTEGSVLGFDRVTYLGSIENDRATVEPITLSEGYVPGVVFELRGELENHFSITSQGAAVTVTLLTTIPEQSIPANRIIVLELQASAPQALPAYATLVFEYVVDDEPSTVIELIFAQTYYTGSYYTEEGGLVFTTPISLIEGYDATVQFALEGDQAQWFTLEGPGNSQTLVLSSSIPAGVLANNRQLVFVVNAQRAGSKISRATIVISLDSEYTEGSVLGFDRVTYLGSIENDRASVEPITLSEGYVPGVVFELRGELENHFSITSQGAAVTVTLLTPIPEQSIPANRIIVLEMQASAPQALPAYATLVFEYVVDDEPSTVIELIFAQTYYTGSYYTEEGSLVFTTPISLIEGYDATVQFALEGDQAQWFTLEGLGNSQTLVLSSSIPAGVLANNRQLVFVVNAQRAGSKISRATIVISLDTEYTEGSVLGFDRVTYLGSIENDRATVEPITLSEGYVPGVVFELRGELENHFSITSQGAAVTVTLLTPIPEQSIPANRIIVLEMQASAPQALPAYATLVFEYVVDDEPSTVIELIFAQTYYTGSYYTEEGGLVFTTPISLIEGYDATVQFALEGDQAQWFTLEGPGNSQTLVLSSSIPAGVLANNRQLVFVVNAQRAGSKISRATIVISLIADSQTGSDESFEKVIFEGIIQNGIVSHETIRVTRFSGTTVELLGEYSVLFEAVVINGEVTISAVGSLTTLPADTTHIALELRAGAARAVLVLDVIQTDVPTPVVVSFSSSSYAVRVTITDTGLVGQVHASADNGEAIRYSLLLDNAHLQERLSINDVGELHLSAPVNSGLYSFQVVATTTFTQESGTAIVHLTAETITVCGDEIVMPPLIVLDRDEEEAHYDLISTYEGCHFSLSNRWPLDQTWLYVDETGLHTTPIDREHESIAFMTLSQVQVEITLHCETDEMRVKRSLNHVSVVPSDYGSSRWILTDTIQYNSRRSFVNLIVNDINDNAPVFIGKEHEPIVVGYPVQELEEIVLPRSLAELQATDADIGENAELLYWSRDLALAVAPTTGFVHIRDGATIENDARLTVYATDRNGHEHGLTGSIDLIVKLLDSSNIAVVTVRDAFLDNEKDIISNLSESVGYEIKVLRSVVISDSETNAEPTRKKRDITSTGASLQLYVYGLIDRQPVSIEQLTSDITDAVIAEVNIASTVSLEDHLADQEICVIPGRDTGLLVATIVLSVLLFIIIVLIAVWFFLRWRRNRNYDEFSDANSLASRNESIGQITKPAKEIATKPRLNIEELKRSERRLQERLDAPIQEVTVEPSTSTKDTSSRVDMPLLPDPNASIVIQSIDKLKDGADDSSDDEFGERRRPKRKSVVTFNENVEKIIHIEDTEPSPRVENGYEIYKL